MKNNKHDFTKQEVKNKALYKLGIYFNDNPNQIKTFLSYYPDNPEKAMKKLKDLFTKWNEDGFIKSASIYDHQRQDEKGMDMLLETLK